MKNADYRVAFGVFAVLLGMTELGLRLMAPRWLGASRGIPLVSRELLDARLHELRKQGGDKHTLLFLGDSVAWGSALRAHHEPAWQTKTPGAFIEAALPASWRLVELSGDGLLATDLSAILKRSLALRPEAVVIELNYRMLGPGSSAPPQAYSRAWLDPSLSATTISEKAESGLRRHCALFLESELGAAILFAPSIRDTLSGCVDRLFPAEQDQDAEDALLDLKLKPYYAIGAQDPQHLGLRAIADMAGRLRESGIRTLIFLTPQNLERVGAYLDREAFDLNRGAMADAAGPGFQDWSLRAPAGKFLDHCHLDPAGNKGLAGWILGDLAL